MKNEGAYTLSIEFEPFDVGDVRIQRLLYKHLLTLEPERLRIVTFVYSYSPIGVLQV